MARPEDTQNPFSKLVGSIDNDEELTEHPKFRAACESLPNGPPLCYDTLQSSRHIRLLTLHPDKLEDTIRCELKTVVLGSLEADYAALSYTWGDLARRLPITCGEAIALIPINLYSALLRLRSPIQKRVLWIDSLCINQASDQDSLEERAHQVKMMGQIYSRAAKVIVDLGGAGEAQTKALSFFLANGKRDVFRRSSSAGVSDKKPDYYYQLFWTGFGELVDRPWFRRIWVIQEFVRAREIKMRIGSLTIPEHILHHLHPLHQFYPVNDEEGSEEVSTVRSDLQNSMDLVLAIENISFMLVAREARHEFNTKVSLSFILEAGIRCETTCRRDRIYGMLGLMEDEISSQIFVDYKETDDQFEERIGKVMLGNDLAAECLGRAKGFGARGASWAPSILCTSRSEILRSLFKRNYLDLFKACGTSNTRQSVRLMEETLVTLGVRIDTIEQSSDVIAHFTEFSDAGDAFFAFINWYRNISLWADEHFMELQSTIRCRTLWQTSTWDQIDDRSRGQSRRFANVVEVDHVRESFEDWIRGGARSQELSNPRRLRSMSFWPNGRVCRTARGRMASIPKEATMGDEIWIMRGVTVPLVLRRIDSGHGFVGLCYVHDMMDGQVVNIPGQNFETIHIH